MIDLERFQKGLNELGEKLDSLGEDRDEELTEMKQRLDLLAQDYAGVVADRWYLTEQVAQLTAERNEARAETDQLQTEAGAAILSLEEGVTELRAEVTRLTEALAAAESQRDDLQAHDARAILELEAAERDRDAANRLLVRAKGQLQTFAHTTISRAALMTDLDSHLSGQPAQAPTSTLGHPGADEVFARLRQSRQPAAPTPESIRAASTQTPGIIDLSAAEVELAALRERVARAIAALTRNHVRRALEALRGR